MSSKHLSIYGNHSGTTSGLEIRPLIYNFLLVYRIHFLYRNYVVWVTNRSIDSPGIVSYSGFSGVACLAVLIKGHDHHITNSYQFLELVDLKS